MVVGDYVVALDQVLGRGSNATVFLGRSRKSGRKVAVKVVEKAGLSAEKRSELAQEVELLRSLQAHPGIVRLLDVYEEADERVFLVFEYKSSDLHSFIRKHRPLSEETVRVVFKQLVDAIEFCHRNNVCHRDLKIENVLIDEDTLEVAVADFGFATRYEPDKRLSKWCGSPHTVAPEIILRQAYCPEAVDVWALGSILYSLLCGSFPFQGKNFKEIFHRTTVGVVHPFPSSVSQEARDLVVSILKTRPESRPTIADIRRHSLLTQHATDYE